MLRVIVSPIKLAFLRLLHSRGYVVLKQTDFASLLARVNSVQPAPVQPAPQAQHDPGPSPPPPPSELVSDAANVEGFMQRARGIIGDTVPPYAPALYNSARYLVENGVSGDVIACSDGSATDLSLLAIAFMMLDDASRRLVLFDVSGDASHRPDTELPLWGIDTSDISDPQTARFAKTIAAQKPLPQELVATYPENKIKVLHYPVDTMDLSRSIAYLSLVADSYDSNRAAIGALLPRVKNDGIIAVEGAGELRTSLPGCVQHQIDAVEQYLRQAPIKLEFWHATDRFRVAIRRQPESNANYQESALNKQSGAP